jgi:serine/threonine protein kinase
MSKDPKATLLAVEDDPNIQQLLTVLLSRRGYRLLIAGTGQQALEYLKQDKKIALILLDLGLPDYKDLELLQSLRRDPALKKIPVIITTARKDTQTIVSALESGASDYVIKPFDLLVLVARIQAQLRSLAPATPSSTTPVSALPSMESGKLLEGKYRLEEKIGEGGLSRIFRGVHLPLDRSVAIKILLPAPAVREKAQAQARFRLEGMISARLQHPNAVTVFDFGSSEGTPFLVMELLKGNNLAEELAKKKLLSPKRCVELLLPICQALSYAHQLHIIHRDIKPENIFLHQTPYGEMPKLLDFGLAKTGEPTETVTTQPGYLWGTLSYLAPERILAQPYDHKSDLYSLGITLYELLAGRLPFLNDSQIQEAAMHVTAEPPPITEQFIPTELDDLMRQALQKDPKQRPSTVDFVTRLTTLQTSLGLSPGLWHTGGDSRLE